MNRLAYVAPDHQLHLLDLDRDEHTQLTLSLANNPLLVWGQPNLPANGYSWPCWSPNGEQIACFMRARGADQPLPAQLRKFIRDRLSPQKTPAHWIWVDEWPLTGSGKIQKFRLAEQFDSSDRETL